MSRTRSPPAQAVFFIRMQEILWARLAGRRRHAGGATARGRQTALSRRAIPPLQRRPPKGFPASFSYFVGDVPSEETFGAEKEDEQEHGKSNDVFPVRAVGNEAGGHGLENADRK